VTHFDQLRAVKKFDGIFKKKKTCTVFLSSYRKHRDEKKENNQSARIFS